SDWTFNAIAGDEVLTLNRQYFQLRKPLERRLYELARKHCGMKPEWRCGLDKLQARTGSTSTEKEFRRLVRVICKADEEHGHMPDYAFRLEDDVLVVTARRAFLEKYTAKPDQDTTTGGPALPLSAEALERARELAPTWDVAVLADEWRGFAARCEQPPKDPEAAFLGFCRSWFEKRGRNGH
ncbi:MAG: replication initiator protein A, partial [Shimia sp.]